MNGITGMYLLFDAYFVLTDSEEEFGTGCKGNIRSGN
jgi:hypothetical protein